jgi:hypothetical protein
LTKAGSEKDAEANVLEALEVEEKDRAKGYERLGQVIESRCAAKLAAPTLRRNPRVAICRVTMVSRDVLIS